MDLSELRTKAGGHEVAGQAEPREVVGEEERQEVVEVAQHPEVAEQVSIKAAGHEVVERETAP